MSASHYNLDPAYAASPAMDNKTPVRNAFFLFSYSIKILPVLLTFNLDVERIISSLKLMSKKIKYVKVLLARAKSYNSSANRIARIQLEKNNNKKEYMSV